MRIGVVLLGLAAAIASTYLTIWLVRYRTLPAAPAVTKSAGEENGPKLSPTPPWPKAVVSESEFSFGRMEVGEERTHAFVIKNEGDAPLVLEKGPTTCQCTISELGVKEIPPGQSAEISFTWKPTAQAEHFDKGGEIRTNDPQNRVFKFSIVGMVAPRLVLEPPDRWILDDIQEGTPTTFVGTITSPVVDHFEILALESGSPHMTAETLPLPKGKFKALKAKSGYEIKVTIAPDVPAGAFASTLRIKTDLPQRNADGTLGDPTVLSVNVSGSRRGPLRILGREWVEDDMAISLGSFDSKEGRKVSLTMLVKNCPAEGLKVSEITSDLPDLKVSVDPDPTFKGTAKRFALTLDYPPGASRIQRRNENPAKVKITTNHPEAPIMEFKIYISAY